MNDINRWLATGRITRDPQLKVTGAGTKVLEFGLAVNESRQTSNGGREDRANFFDCVMFGNRAEPLAQILTKGMPVTVEGSLRWSQWEKDGQRRSKITVFVDNIALPPRQSQQEPQYAGYSMGGQPLSFQPASISDEDIPF